jgi:hypothetical protein
MRTRRMPCAQTAAAPVAGSAAGHCANTVAAAAATWDALLHCEGCIAEKARTTVVNVSHGVLLQMVTHAQGGGPARRNGSSRCQAMSVRQSYTV